MMRLIPVFFLVIFLGSCSKERKTPDDILPKQAMTDLLVDIHIADGYAASAPPDSVKKYATVYYHSIFKKHRTDYKGLRRNLDYYMRRPDLYKEIYDSVKVRLEKLEARQQNAVQKTE
jgi:hypothetical protein